MIKKCKQCGCTLVAGESNNICEKCRQYKRDKQVEERVAAAEAKKKKYH